VETKPEFKFAVAVFAIEIVNPVYAAVDAFVTTFQARAVIWRLPTRPAALNSDAVIMNCALDLLFPPWNGDMLPPFTSYAATV